MARDLIVGVDIGGTQVRMGLGTAALALVDERTLPTVAVAADGARTAERLLDAIGDFIGDRLGDVRALCMGFPSVVSRDRRRLVQTPNVLGLDDVALADLAEARFPFPALVEKDVNLLLRHDLETLGVAVDQTVLGVYVGTGLGSAIWIDGQFYPGAAGASGELGHIPLHGVRERCGCGNLGCAETVASGRRLVEAARARFPDEPIADFFTLHGGDAFAGEYVADLAEPIAVAMNLLDPAVAILGGGVLHMRDFPRARLVDEVRARLRRPFPRDSAAIQFSSDSRAAGVLGAVRHALEHLARAPG
jgi:allose kinase